MEQNLEENKVILKKAYKYLEGCLLNSKIFLLIKDENSKEKMAEKIILDHLMPPERVTSLNCIVKRFILSSINANMSDEDLYNKMCREFNIEKGSTTSVMYKFCVSIISIGKYFADKKFKDAQTFYQYIDENSQTIKEKEKLSKEISSKLYNIGIALAQDALKELGCSQFGKPDIHIIDIFEIIFKEEQPSNNFINQKFEDLYKSGKSLPYISNIYSVDKLFWLIGSGFFYKYDLNLGSLKQDFLEEYSADE